MNLVAYLMESRGVVNAAQRLPKIALRFGVTAARMERALLDYTDIAREYSATPTLFVTGNLLERYPQTFRRVADSGAEFGVHGYVHTDYARLPLERQSHDLERTLSSFRRLGITATGFRAPYLRWNSDSVSAARAAGLQFSSNRGVAWDVLQSASDGKHGKQLEAYQKALRLYGAVPSAQTLSLPAPACDNILDLPASLPDDEAIVDRLRLKPQQRERVWRDLVRQAHHCGELLVHTLHHERLALCRGALRAFLDEALAQSPRPWFASLQEIATWWRRRSKNPMDIEPLDGHKYKLVGGPGDDATILARGLATNGVWYDRWSIVEPGAALESPSPPWISVPRDSSPELAEFLKNEGFVVRLGEPDQAALHLDGWRSFRPEDSRRLLAEIEATTAPLVRLWRWPRRARFAISLTGDVDSMSLLDFLRRPFEV